MAEANMPFGGATGAPYRQVQTPPQPHMQAAAGYQARPHAPAEPRASNAMGLTQIAGALVSLSLIAGVSVWGYKLIMRDVSGIPVVQATEGPMRVAPEDPGGSITANQGLAVNEVAGRGAASGPVDQLTLAPTPVDLTTEDASGAQLQLTSVSPEIRPAATPTARAVTEAEDIAVAPPAPVGTDLQDAAIQALADQIAAGVAPLSETSLDGTPPVQTNVTDPGTDAETNPVAAASAAPDARSLRPQARPGALRTASVAPVAAPATATSADALDLNAADLPVGTRLVQLGAYDSTEVAQAEWSRIAGRFDTFFDGKRRVIERAQSGGRTFYRLRAEGFADLADARRFCAALVAERADCIPVVTR
ncbi:SPOR domain-containing protein [Primorskyibacter sp. S187A]|uniref:SPOR domain-containing protein n=1 Tax=Primorskyibacter sp. S187A TaxID=3415130 RepID=UPI003C7E92CB